LSGGTHDIARVLTVMGGRPRWHLRGKVGCQPTACLFYSSGRCLSEARSLYSLFARLDACRR
jgi:hypothetical protein